MAKFRISCKFKAEVRGTVDSEFDVDIEPGSTKDQIAEAAEDQVAESIQHELESCGCGSEISIDEVCDVELNDIEVAACPGCGGKGYVVSVIAEGDGLLKVGPCTRCLRVPTPKDAVDVVMELIKEQEEE